MSNLQQGLAIVSNATKKDNDGEYLEASSLYEQAIQYFLEALEEDENENMKQLIQQKTLEYQNRLTKIREHLFKTTLAINVNHDNNNGNGSNVNNANTNANSASYVDISNLRSSLENTNISNDNRKINNYPSNQQSSSPNMILRSNSFTSNNVGNNRVNHLSRSSSTLSSPQIQQQQKQSSSSYGHPSNIPYGHPGNYNLNNPLPCPIPENNNNKSKNNSNSNNNNDYVVLQDIGEDGEDGEEEILVLPSLNGIDSNNNNNNNDDNQTIVLHSEIGSQDQQNTVSLVQNAAGLITSAKAFEINGNFGKALTHYQNGLDLLNKAYLNEKNEAVKEVLRSKLSCLITRAEEIKASKTPFGLKMSNSTINSLKIVDTLSKKARYLGDNASVDGAINLYGDAVKELKKALANETVIETRVFLARRILVLERRTTDLSFFLRYVRYALPYPYSMVFGIGEGLIRHSGVGKIATKQVDNVLVDLSRRGNTLNPKTGNDIDDIFYDEEKDEKFQKLKNKKKKKKGFF
eukprot:TRINITY_DN3485_c0_g1_i1.p1 TRINITY_DN3485_c0_g1~~TRINITY_DN3485_c0_g1_i1.p1  ORF type:complete len:520 (+),score=195.71 TRINITY_DN3485_c0_g1_i1:42-1601(+)